MSEMKEEKLKCSMKGRTKKTSQTMKTKKSTQKGNKF